MLDFEEYKRDEVKLTDKPQIDIYTDGGCVGNGKDENTGGIGIVFVCDDKIIKKLGKQFGNTTNNQMELLAIITAMEIIVKNKLDDRKIILYSDSAYCVDGSNKWMYEWKLRGWKRGKKAKEEVKNVAYWKRLHELREDLPHLEIKWIKAHVGHKYNELADELTRF